MSCEVGFGRVLAFKRRILGDHAGESTEERGRGLGTGDQGLGMKAGQLLTANRRGVAPTLMEGSLRPNCSLAASGSAMSRSFPK